MVPETLMSASNPWIEQLSAEEWAELEKVIDRFETAWQQGPRPSIDDYLVSDSVKRLALLIELVRSDLACCLRAGEPVRIESYLEPYPELEGLLAAPDPETVLPSSAMYLKDTLPRPGFPPGANPPPQVPGYEILGELGRGGMGVVYKARQLGLNRLVALKMILAGGFAGPEEKRRFRAEAEALAGLRHPNIVQIHQIGEYNGTPCFSLEYCEGGSLADRLKGTPLPPAEAARVVQTLSRAMQAAHDLGIVHRDLKPANILLTGDQSDGGALAALKITDFGLAKKLGEAGQTASGQLIGTPSYMAPEQAEGNAKDVGPAADIYALGAILYELLTGRPPFKAATGVETVFQVLREEPAAPSRVNARVPPDLETICLKCLEKEEGKRYGRAGDLAADLGRFLGGEPITARPAGRIERTAKWVKRRPLPAALIGLSIVFVVSLIVGSVWLWQTVLQLDSALGKADRERDKAEESNAIMRRFLEAGDLRLLHQLWKGGDVKEMQPWLERYQERAGKPPDELGYFYRYVHRLAHDADDRVWRGPEGQATLVAYHPEGRLTATAVKDGAISLRDREAKTRLELTGHPGGVHWLGFLADGRRLASIGNDKTIRFWDCSTGKKDLDLSMAGKPVTFLTISADGRLVAAMLRDGKAQVWETAHTDRVLFTLEGNRPDRISCLAFSPDGETLAGGVARGVWFWDVKTRQRRGDWVMQQAEVVSLAYSPRGWFLAAGLQSGGVTVWPVGKINLSFLGETSRDLSGHRGPVRALAFSSDDLALASGSNDATVRLWDVRSGQIMNVLRGSLEPIRAVAFSPDSLEVAAASDEGPARRWDRLTNPDWLSTAAPLRPQGPLAFTPDGKTIVVPCMDHRVALLDASSRRIQTWLQGCQGEVLAVAVSGDGALLAAASLDLTVRTWSLPEGRLTATYRVEDFPRCVALSPDGRLVAVGLGDGRVRWWETVGGKERPALTGHTAAVLSIAFSPDGKILASGGADPTVRFWDAASGMPLPIQLADHANTRHIAFTPDGKALATLRGEGPELRLWDPQTGKQVSQIRLDPTHSFHISREGAVVLANATGFTVFDLNTGQRLAWNGHGFGFPASNVAISPDGEVVAAVGDDHVLRLCNWKTLQLQRPPGQAPVPICALAFAADGRTLYTGMLPHMKCLQVRDISFVGQISPRAIYYRGSMSESGNDAVTQSGVIQQWDADTGEEKPRALPDQPSMGAHCLARSPDGRTLLAGTPAGAVFRWDLSTGKALPRVFMTPQAEARWNLFETALKVKPGSPDQPGAGVAALTVSPDGKYFACASDDGALQIRDLATGKLETTLSHNLSQLAAVAYSPDGATLASNDGSDVVLWDAATSRERRRLTAHRQAVSCLAYSPDGKWLASGGLDRRVILWNLGNGRRHELIGHTDVVTSLAFAPDGQLLASAGWDGAVRLWHVATLMEVANLQGQRGRINAVAFSPDGNILASGSASGNDSGEVLFWRAKAGRRPSDP
jgi:eukaryotic-like serine/threonine-protein kinase